jgi:ferritin-like metal-binding protein YciE
MARALPRGERLATLSKHSALAAITTALEDFMSRTPKVQLIHFLSDMYSVEQQALAQLVSAPDIVDEPELANAFRLHYSETEEQSDTVRERLEANGGSPSKIKDAIMEAGGKGFLLFAKAMPETPGRLVVHSYAYEAMEWAGYEMLGRFARRAGDVETVAAAEQIGAQERDMMQRLADGFDAVEAIAHADKSQEELAGHIRRHLAEVHAFESQSVQLLKKSKEIAGNETLADLYRRQLSQISKHAEVVEQQLKKFDSGTSKIEDGALAMGGTNWGLFFQAQADTPSKLAAFIYAVLNLEIAGYEMLKRTANRSNDSEIVALCTTLIAEKLQMADELSAAFDSAVDATLSELRPA